MSSHNAGPYTMTITSSETDSPALSAQLSAGQLKVLFGSCVGFTIATPSALTGTVTLQGVPLEGSSSWVTVQAGGSDVTLAASKILPVDIGAIRDIRIHSSSAEASNRDFLLTFQLAVTC